MNSIYVREKRRVKGLSTPDLQAMIKATAAKAGKEKAALPEPKGSPQTGQLPKWPEHMRGVPNSILRSGLFGINGRGSRSFMQRKPISSLKGITILQTGPRLDQADRDVWEQCLHLARIGGLGTRIQFAVTRFLKDIGRATGGKDVRWLKGAFARLASTVVEIEDGKRAYFGALIRHGTRDDETSHWIIEINLAIAKLFEKGAWSQFEFEQRQALKKQPLAQWLHGFYITHAVAYRIKVETIHRLSGSEARQMKHFRAELRSALSHLEAATGWLCEIDDADLVKISKKPTGSQARHLIRKKLGTG